MHLKSTKFKLLSQDFFDDFFISILYLGSYLIILGPIIENQHVSAWHLRKVFAHQWFPKNYPMLKYLKFAIAPFFNSKLNITYQLIFIIAILIQYAFNNEYTQQYTPTFDSLENVTSIINAFIYAFWCVWISYSLEYFSF